MKTQLITDQNKLFFTSDTHFFHANIIKYANRPFESVEEMNEALIRNWNEVVPEDGVVYHLGDFSFGWSKEWWSIIPKLNGKIHLILGNHDMNQVGKSYMGLFASVQEQATINVNGQTIILNHNPFLCFGGAYKDTWQLFGHVHSGPNSPRNGLDESRLKYLFPTQYDVGVDNNDYRPISYAQVRAKILEQIRNHVDNVKFKNAVDYDIVHEIINTMFCETIKKRNSCVDPAERGSLEAEIEIFRDELKLLNSGTEKDFERLAEKAYNVYSPLIRSQNEEADKSSL